MLDVEPVDIFGSAPDAPVDEVENPTDEEKKGDEEAGDEEGDDEAGDDKNKGGKGDGEEDDGDDEEGDFDVDEIDLEKETDPEKLRKAAQAHAAASKNKTESIKNLRRARRRSAAASSAPEVGDYEAPYSKEETTLVKDLPKDEQEKMTDTEKRLWDDGVKVKIRLNEEAKEKHDSKVEAAKKAAENIDESIVLDDELEDFAKDLALETAGGDKKVANEILKYFNRWDNKNLKEDEVIDRIEDAFKLTKNYQPPKDQQRKKGKSVKKNNADESGVDAIVKSLDESSTKKAIDL